MVRSTWRPGIALLVGIGAMALPALALPNPDKPIDASKRAPISTANAVQPSATTVKGDGVVGGRVIPMSQIPIRRAAGEDRRAAVDVRETREKERVIRPTAKSKTARSVEVTRAVDRPAAIPRIDANRFRQMLRTYEDNRVPATSMIAGDIQVGEQRVSLGDINRFANPRATLEAQGIPVTTAASSDAPAAGTSQTVPIPQEKNGGSTSGSSSGSR